MQQAAYARFRDAAGIVTVALLLVVGMWLGAEAMHAWVFAFQHPALWQPDTL